MKPLFTLLAGEYLVGRLIEARFRHTNHWVPAKRTGVDLLVSDRRNPKPANGRCYESRGLGKRDRLAIAAGESPMPRERDLTRSPGGWPQLRERIALRVPAILRARRYRLILLSNERGEPPHIHVEQAERHVKIWVKQ